jgi:hypothetical protein
VAVAICPAVYINQIFVLPCTGNEIQLSARNGGYTLGCHRQWTTLRAEGPD